MSNNPIEPTPCIGVCSTGIGDIVCRGCKRFAHEVIGWNGYTNDQRRVVNERLAMFLEQVMVEKFDIVDQQQLLTQLEFQQITYKKQASAYCWLYDLLKAGAGQIKSTDKYGFVVKPPWQDHTLEALKVSIDDDFYTLSCAHYERFIDPVTR